MYKTNSRNQQARRVRAAPVAHAKGKDHYKKQVAIAEKRTMKRVDRLDTHRVFSGIVIKARHAGVFVDIGGVWGILDEPLAIGQLVMVTIASKRVGTNGRPQVILARR